MIGAQKSVVKESKDAKITKEDATKRLQEGYKIFADTFNLPKPIEDKKEVKAEQGAQDRGDQDREKVMGAENKDVKLSSSQIPKRLSPQAESLAKIVYAFSKSKVKVNGQTADTNYPVAAYFASGGRVMFDLSKLNTQQQSEFWDLLFKKNSSLFARTSSHRISGQTASGAPAEIADKTFTKYYHSIANAFSSTQLGMNLPIGGEGAVITPPEKKLHQ